MSDVEQLTREDLEKIRAQQIKIQAHFTILGERTKKDKNRYLFIGRNAGDFSGNVKYLFLHFIKNHPELDCTFLTHHRSVYKDLKAAGLPAILFPVDDFDVIAKSGTVVADAISYRNHLYYPLLKNARQVQLWHGVGNKKIGFQLEGVPCLEGKPNTLVQDHSDYDIFVSTSPFYTEEVFKKSLHAHEFVSLGYPRTDVFFEKLSKEAMIGCDVQSYAKVKQARKKGPVIMFTPTFRDSDINPLTQNVLDFQHFSDFLKQFNAHLLLKMHTRSGPLHGSVPDNITICQSNSDIYPFMPLADIMITDYSSIYTEYLLLDRPVIYFWCDFDSYMSWDRGFQFPFEPMCPGPKCRQPQELYQAVADALQGKDSWKNERRKMRDKAFAHTEGDTCKRITDYLLNDPNFKG